MICAWMYVHNDDNTTPKWCYSSAPLTALLSSSDVKKNTENLDSASKQKRSLKFLFSKAVGT
jgi:hypothetical protein